MSRITVSVDGTELTKPFAVSWSQTENKVGEASFSLVLDDPQAALCVQHQLATITKDGVTVFHMRIESVVEVTVEDGGDYEVDRWVVSGPEATAELKKAVIHEAPWPGTGAGDLDGRHVSSKPWDRVRLFGYPDPQRAIELAVDAGGIDNITAINDDRPEGWPDPQAYWVGDSTGADVAYFVGILPAPESYGTEATYWFAFRDAGEVYHNGKCVISVSAEEADPTKCWRVVTEVTPGLPQVFVVKVRRTTSTNAVFAFTYYDADGAESEFMLRTWDPINDWGIFADPATPPGTTAAKIVLDALYEYELRSGESLGWTTTFDAVNDSGGTPWATIPIFPAGVGDSLLDVLERLSNTWVEWGVELDVAARTLSMWNAKGVDTPDGPAPGRGAASGVTIVEAVNATDLSVESTSDGLVNSLLVRYANGHIEVNDAASIATWDRHEGFLDLGDVSEVATVERLARENLALTAQPVVSVTAQVDDSNPADGHSVFVDFGMGDSVTVETTSGPLDLRLVSASVEEDDDGNLDVVCEWGTTRDSLEEQNNRWLARTSNGTLDGRSPTPVPSPTSPSLKSQGVAQVVRIPFGTTGGGAVATGDIATRARVHVEGLIYGVEINAEVAGTDPTVFDASINGTTFATGLEIPAASDEVTVYLPLADITRHHKPDSTNIEITSAGGHTGFSAQLLVAPVGDS